MRYPLLIDPQSQGKNWIKNKEKLNQLIVTTLGHKYFRYFIINIYINNNTIKYVLKYFKKSC